MAEIQLNVNGETRTVSDVPEDMPLLWVLRDMLGLNGTKFGCGKALCGACTVHVDGKAVRSCSLPVGSLEGSTITTIEGLSAHGDHPVQLAWMEANVPQCGYCQTGQIMNAAAMLAQISNPSDEEINNMMAGNICRCGTYNRIREAIHLAIAKGGAQ